MFQLNQTYQYHVGEGNPAPADPLDDGSLFCYNDGDKSMRLG